MALELTKGQKQAIEEYGKNIIVSAGAGSGKTFVLTERVLHFIKNHNYHLNDFLILTFTNLAAGEMKERIRKKLTSNNLPDASLVDTSDICTFDSYALALVKKYHFLLGVSSNISIVDSNIISVRKRTIINDLFEELYKNKDEEFLSFINRFCFNDDVELRTLVFKFYNHALNELDTNSYLDNFVNNYYHIDLFNEIIDIYTNKIKTIVKEIKSLIITLPDVPLKKGAEETFYAAVVNELSGLFNAESYDDLIANIPPTIKVSTPRGLTKSDGDAIKDFRAEYKKLADFVVKIPSNTKLFVDYLNESLPYTKIIIKLVKEVDCRLKAYKTKYQIFEFNDIAKLALNLLKTNQEVRNSLKTSLKMIMIDEYQDTSVLQEAFINLIENNNVYMVGDVKQSIYRFRNAKCDIFIDKYNKYKYEGLGLAIDLNKNFRSRHEVLDDINYIFKNLMTNNYGGASYIDDHLIECGNSDFDNLGKLDVSSHSDFIIHNAKGLTIIDTEANIIARDIIEKINNHYQVFDNGKLRDVKFSDFCILMDRGVAFDEYYKVFSSYQIPLFIVNDENIKDATIVKLLTNILKIVKAIFNKNFYEKEFKKAFVSVARSFLYNYSDEEIYKIVKNNLFKETIIFKTIKDSLFNNSTLPLALKIENLLFDLDIYNKCIKSGNVIKNEKYLDLFINLFKDMTRLDYTLDDFLVYLENIDTYNLKITLSSSGSNIDSVKLMNIHKSKGLEFKIVYFSGLYKSFNQEEFKPKYGISKKFGLYYPPINEEQENILQILSKEHELNEQISEQIRLFYVALTRTKEKMIFVLSHEEYDKLFSEYNKQILFNFINNHDLLNQDALTRCKLIINGYLNKKISLDIFKELLGMFNYDLNEEFYTLKNNEIVNLDFNYFLENINFPVNNLINETYIEHSTKIEKFTLSYKNDEISQLDYLNFINLLDYQVDQTYLNNLNSDEICLSKLIINPRYQYHKDADSIFINNLITRYSDITFLLRYYKMYFNLYPNEDYLYKAIFDFNDRIISKEELLKIIKYLGYKLNFEFNDYIIIDELSFDKDILPNSLMVKIIELNGNAPFRKFKYDASLKLIFKDYLDKKINLIEFKDVIILFGFTFNKDFDACEEKEKLNYTIFDIYKVIVDIDKYELDYPNMLSFKLFLNPFVNSYLFEKRFVDINTINPVLNINTNIINKEKLEIQELNIKNESIKKFRASKKLDVDSSKKNMEFGSKIHFLLEILDFNNPDYSFIKDDYYISIIKDFLGCPLLNNISNGTIYKEYEFFNHSTNTTGIIDLMIVYEDYIDIIDYKTKNIHDDSYLKQLAVYEEFISNSFNKPVNTYLYSLLDRNYKLCNK